MLQTKDSHVADKPFFGPPRRFDESALADCRVKFQHDACKGLRGLMKNPPQGARKKRLGLPAKRRNEIVEIDLGEGLQSVQIYFCAVAHMLSMNSKKPNLVFVISKPACPKYQPMSGRV